MIRAFLLLLLLFAAPAMAQPRETAITPELVAEGPAAPGGEIELAILMRPKPGWHGYWLNPGDAGLPMTVEWQLPKGVLAGPLRYPVPTRLSIFGLMNYVYEREYAVLVRLKVPEGASGAIPIRASARWLACTDKVCVPEAGTIALDLPVGAGPPTERARFDEWRRALPRPLATPSHFALSGDRLRIAIPLPSGVSLGDPYIFPAADGPVEYAAPQRFRRSGDTLTADLQRRRGEPTEFSGVLALGDGRGLAFTATPGDVPKGGLLVGGLGAGAIVFAVLGAIAGGFLLNLMPCVFPILALKALHLARGGGEEGETRRDALAYAAGAIVGTGALGAVLLAIRAGGSAAGWAFQLQEPRTILFLMLLAVGISLNLLGLFAVPALGGRARPTGGFATGALAAFVATPCAGPFLGAALGTALLLPPAGSLLVFAALGLGLAIPFVAVAFIPALRNRLPKPGPWMARLQRFLAIPMVATALACLWLLWRVGGLTALEVGLVAAAVVALLLVGTGLLQRKGKQSGYWAAMAAVAVAVLSVSVMPHRSAVGEQAIEGVEPWSEARVSDSLRQGHPVFVYFTADWCLTCKANEVAAIDREAVRQAFREHGVLVFAGDWTNGDPTITRFLDSRGRAGVPLYLWYEPGKPPEELPQILTPGTLISRAQQPR
jgi:DsbC/DsbD-like thiol-disulfide interchange protein/cytochrome c biogenesis protein CcdA